MSDALRRPTDGELNILRVLWAQGPSTVRQVHNALSGGRTISYTTTLKMMQVMHDKGLVARDTSRRSHVYTPVHSEDRMQRHLVGDLLDKAFGGSPSRLVMHALQGRAASDEELDAIRSLLDSLQEKP